MPSSSSSSSVSSTHMDSSYIFPFIILFLYASLISIYFLRFYLFKRVKRADEIEQDPQSKTSISSLEVYLPKLSDKTLSAHHFNSTHLPQSILLELLSSVNDGGDSKKFDEQDNESGINGKIVKKKKKKRKVKKKSDLQVRNDGVNGRKDLVLMNSYSEEELVCLSPFTSSSSATQRKIKQQYDELVKSQKSKRLTSVQVGQFVNCLVDARNELQLKSECIRRKFTITKALLLKADRSSFDRLRKQIYKLELEQKRLEDDTFVYNRLQHQLKLSNAYKKMVEISEFTELNAKCSALTENHECEQDDISFEEFLEQEKKDTFWQNYSKPKRSSM